MHERVISAIRETESCKKDESFTHQISISGKYCSLLSRGIQINHPTVDIKKSKVKNLERQSVAASLALQIYSHFKTIL